MKCKYNNVGKWISVLHRQFIVYVNHAVKDLNMNSSEFMYLMNLYENEGISQEELSQILMIDKAATARAIKNLIEHGYVTKVRSDVDKRAYCLHLTDKAHSIQEEVKEVMYKWNCMLSCDLEDVCLDHVISGLKQMSENVLENKSEIV